MIRKLIVLDDELASLLAKHPNQSETVRQALRIYISDITPATLEGLRASYVSVAKKLHDMDSKLDYIAGRLR